MFIYFNGQIVPKNEASVSVFEHGFLYGVGLFETFRIYEGHPFLLDDHLQRLNEGLKELLIEKIFTKVEVEEAITLLLNSNGYQNAYIRFNVSAGIGELGLTTDPYEEPNIIIYTKPLPPADNDIQEKEARLLTLRRNTPEGTYRLKSHHFLNNILAKREIGNRMDVEGLFLTANGDLAEGIVSNLFWVKNKTIYTPSVNTGILNGITRQFILKLVAGCEFSIKEGFFKPVELDSADEIFITNSIQEVVGINRWNNRDYPGKNGEITKYLHSLYRHYSSKIVSRNEL
ncbi:MAG TPA: aminodeoxychorismate lyase [Pseudoneobacillus sp.]|nr:aminodeoxychorismate lyase [Pseudoneobacillus sp.]